MPWYTKTKGKKSEKSKAIERADSWFSKFIRISNSFGNGLGACFTCTNVDDIKNMDAGHFVKRNHLSTRYNELNVQLQCRSCNRYRDGEQFKFGVNLDKKYGKGTAEKLMLLGSTTKLKTDYRAISDEYREKFNKEKETKEW